MTNTTITADVTKNVLNKVVLSVLANTDVVKQLYTVDLTNLRNMVDTSAPRGKLFSVSKNPIQLDNQTIIHVHDLGSLVIDSKEVKFVYKESLMAHAFFTAITRVSPILEPNKLYGVHRFSLTAVNDSNLRLLMAIIDAEAIMATDEIYNALERDTATSYIVDGEIMLYHRTVMGTIIHSRAMQLFAPGLTLENVHKF